MSLNLFDQVNARFGEIIHKQTDPVDQETAPQNKTVMHAAIPAVLTGIFHVSIAPATAEAVFREVKQEHWKSGEDQLEEVFGNRTADVIQVVADFAQISPNMARREMEVVTEVAMHILHDHCKANGISTPEEYAAMMVHQREDILGHLPNDLNIGVMLGDDALDDVTNKMHGPLSSLFQKLGALFSEPGESDLQK